MIEPTILVELDNLLMRRIWNCDFEEPKFLVRVPKQENQNMKRLAFQFCHLLFKIGNFNVQQTRSLSNSRFPSYGSDPSKEQVPSSEFPYLVVTWVFSCSADDIPSVGFRGAKLQPNACTPISIPKVQFLQIKSRFVILQGRIKEYKFQLKT